MAAPFLPRAAVSMRRPIGFCPGHSRAASDCPTMTTSGDFTCVALVEEPALQQSNVHGAEIIRRGNFPVEYRVAARTLRGERLPFDDDVGVHADRAMRERSLKHSTGGNRSRQPPCAVEHGIDQRPLLLFRVVLLLGESEVERQHAPRIEAEIETKERREAADEQSGHGQEHHHRGELRRDEQLAGARGRGRRGRRPRTLVKSGERRGAAVAPCGKEPDHDRGPQAQAQREQQRADVDRCLVEARHFDRSERHDRTEARRTRGRHPGRLQPGTARSIRRTVAERSASRRAPRANLTATSRLLPAP